MEKSLAPPGALHLPPPPDWDEAQLSLHARDLRERLLLACADLRTTDQRRDWLLHMTLQTHHLTTLLELIDQFNQSQMVGRDLGYEFIDVSFHELGLFFRRRSDLV
jgi:hypothetical protein